MICPEGAQFQGDIDGADKEDKKISQSARSKPTEGTSVDLSSFKNLKTWRKSFTKFFRNQLRSTRSNDGDQPSGSMEKFEDKGVSPEQKWQSLGKVFKRQSFVEHWNKTPALQGEGSTPSKRFAVRKVISSYFGKNQKSFNVASEK